MALAFELGDRCVRAPPLAAAWLREHSPPVRGLAEMAAETEGAAAPLLVVPLPGLACGVEGREGEGEGAGALRVALDALEWALGACGACRGPPAELSERLRLEAPLLVRHGNVELGRGRAEDLTLARAAGALEAADYLGVIEGGWLGTALAARHRVDAAGAAPRDADRFLGALARCPALADATLDARWARAYVGTDELGRALLGRAIREGSEAVRAMLASWAADGGGWLAAAKKGLREGGRLRWLREALPALPAADLKRVVDELAAELRLASGASGYDWGGLDDWGPLSGLIGDLLDRGLLREADELARAADGSNGGAAVPHAVLVGRRSPSALADLACRALAPRDAAGWVACSVAEYAVGAMGALHGYMLGTAVNRVMHAALERQGALERVLARGPVPRWLAALPADTDELRFGEPEDDPWHPGASMADPAVVRAVLRRFVELHPGAPAAPGVAPLFAGLRGRRLLSYGEASAALGRLRACLEALPAPEGRARAEADFVSAIADARVAWRHAGDDEAPALEAELAALEAEAAALARDLGLGWRALAACALLLDRPGLLQHARAAAGAKRGREGEGEGERAKRA